MEGQLNERCSFLTMISTRVNSGWLDLNSEPLYFLSCSHFQLTMTTFESDYLHRCSTMTMYFHGSCSTWNLVNLNWPGPTEKLKGKHISRVYSLSTLSNRWFDSPLGDCIRFDVPRRRFVDGELLADEWELSVIIIVYYNFTDIYVTLYSLHTA